MHNSAKMNEEEIIKKRLLVDGDGAGDDRRINVLLKQFQQWCDSEVDADGQVTRNHLLSQVNKCEYAYLKSQLLVPMSLLEIQNYTNCSQQIEESIENVKREIISTKEHFKEAKVFRKNRLEYEVLAKVINDQPDRKETNEKLASLKTDLKKLEEKYNELEQKLDMRRKQFHVLFSSLQQLQALLDNDCSNEKNAVDISLETVDNSDDTKTGFSKDSMDVIVS